MVRQRQQIRSYYYYYWQGFCGYMFNLHTERQVPQGIVGTNRYFCQLIQDVFFKNIVLF